MRLSTATHDIIQDTHAQGICNAKMLEWIIDHMIDDRQAIGRQLLRPPPGHDGASTSGGGGLVLVGPVRAMKTRWSIRYIV
jgi:hypothetical protein